MGLIPLWGACKTSQSAARRASLRVLGLAETKDGPTLRKRPADTALGLQGKHDVAGWVGESVAHMLRRQAGSLGPQAGLGRSPAVLAQ